MKIFRAAIIGLGNIGFGIDANIANRYVLSYTRALSLHRGFRLAAGFDIDRDRLRSFENAYKVRGFHYKDLKDNINDIDVVIISVPAKDHFRVFKDVASFCRPRMIIMEKPLALNLHQAREITALSKRMGILLYVNYFRRVDPGIRKLKEYIDTKECGALRHINIYYGNGLLNNGSHFIDLMLYLLGSPDKIKLLRKTDKDNPDFIFYYKQLLVFFKSSVGIDYYMKDMDFVFEKARVTYSCFSQTALMLPRRRFSFGARELVDVGSKGLHLDVERYMSTVAEHIYDVLLGKSDLESSGQTALQTLKVCFDIMKKGKTV